MLSSIGFSLFELVHPYPVIAQIIPQFDYYYPYLSSFLAIYYSVFLYNNVTLVDLSRKC